MSREITNRLGTDDYLRANPRRLHIFNQNYDEYGEKINTLSDTPWTLFVGRSNRGEYATFGAATKRARELTAK